MSAYRDDPQSPAPTPASEPRPFYWSVRRELWENRSVYLAPLIVAAVVLFATSLSTIGLPKKMRRLPTLDSAKGHASIVTPYNMAPAPIMLTTFLVGMFFSLDALYGERRDRSILFWKSLPVSDRTTVLAKASIPLVVLPVIAFALSLVTQIILMLLSTIVLLGNGMNPARLWAEFHLFSGPVVMIYGLTVHALWFAPIYGWLILISAWAKRTPSLWVVLPPLAISGVEKIVFGTTTFPSMLQYRVTGAMKEAFDFRSSGGGDIERLSQLQLGRFLSAPGLWFGLIFTAAFLAAAVRLRRNREPI